MKSLKILASMTVLITLTACGTISSKTTSEATMIDKAETATGVRASELSVIPGSVTSSMDAVNYRVKDTRGNEYKCYFTSVVAVTSDAICTKLGASGGNHAKKQNNPNCNALLQAAGRC